MTPGAPSGCSHPGCLSCAHIYTSLPDTLPSHDLRLLLTALRAPCISLLLTCNHQLATHHSPPLWRFWPPMTNPIL